MVLIGSHVSMKGKDMLLGAAKEAESYGASTMMVYTGAPQNTRRKPTDDMKIPEGQDHMAEAGISNLVVHAPYIVNLGNIKKADNFEFAVRFMKEEIDRAEALGANQMTFHPGAHVGEGVGPAIKQIAKGLNLILREDQKIQIALETMAGKGTEIGKTFEELAQIIEKVDLDHLISVTLDTCHTHDAGYPVRDDFDQVLDDFDRIIGLDRLKVVHINDSKNPLGASKDRHENIGLGEIGFEALNYIVHHPKLADLAKILETPYVGADKGHKKPPYKYEIEMFRKKRFNENLIEDILNQ